MALALCVLDKFLGVVCHCFPPPLEVPTFAARCLYVHNDARDASSERWNCGRERCPVILPKFWLPLKFMDLLHAANLQHGTDGFTVDFFALKNPTASSGFEPVNLGTKGQHATPRPPKPSIIYMPFKQHRIIDQLYLVCCWIYSVGEGEVKEKGGRKSLCLIKQHYFQA